MRWGIFRLSLLLVANHCCGASSYWTNASGGTYSQGLNWVGGVPGNTDTAIFSNATSFSVQWTNDSSVSNAWFQGNGTVTQELQTATWTVGGNYTVGSPETPGATVIHRSGTLRIENDTQSAEMRIGYGGLGRYVLEGGVLAVDNWSLENSGNSVFEFAHGTLHTKSGYLFSRSDWLIGTVPNKTATWLVDGTRTWIGQSASVECGVAPGSRVMVIVSGTNSVLDVFDSRLVLGSDRDAKADLVVTNGGVVNVSGLHELSCGNYSTTNQSSGNRIVVTGPGSALTASFVFLIADSSSLVISNDATLLTYFVYFAGTGQKILFAGTNSQLNCGKLAGYGSGNELTISDGAFLSTGNELYDPNLSLKIIGGTVEMPGVWLGDFLLDHGSLTVEYLTIVPGNLDCRSGVLRVLDYATSESAPLYIGGDSVRATFELSSFDRSEPCFQNSCFTFRGPIILRTNASMTVYGGDVFTSHFTATNGASSDVIFHRGTWTTEGTRIAIGRALKVGDGTNSALVRFSGGLHAFADGLRVLPKSVVTGAGAVVGDITVESEGAWLCNLDGRLEVQSQPMLSVTGNLALHGAISLTNVSRFVPARYVLAACSGTLTTNGMTFRSGLPNSFRARLDTSISGELAVEIQFIGPLPPNYLGNFMAVDSQTSLSFAATNLATYSIEFTESLPPAAWTPLMEVPGISGVMSVVDTNASSPQRFYRLKTVLPP